MFHHKGTCVSLNGCHTQIIPPPRHTTISSEEHVIDHAMTQHTKMECVTKMGGARGKPGTVRTLHAHAVLD